MGSVSRRTLDHELAELRNDLLDMGGLVLAALDSAVDALKRRDAEQAKAVVDGDRKINSLRFRIEEECLMLIATQQPTASDLRRVLAGINMAGDLERMGEHTAGIAKTVLRMREEPEMELPSGLPNMVGVGREMLQQSLQAYRDADPELARLVADRDDELDHLYNATLDVLLAYMVEHPRQITATTYLLWAAHNLERLGDRATNIAERVIFMTTGSMKELNV